MVVLDCLHWEESVLSNFFGTETILYAIEVMFVMFFRLLLIFLHLIFGPTPTGTTIVVK